MQLHHHSLNVRKFSPQNSHDDDDACWKIKRQNLSSTEKSSQIVSNYRGNVRESEFEGKQRRLGIRVHKI